MSNLISPPSGKIVSISGGSGDRIVLLDSIIVPTGTDTPIKDIVSENCQSVTVFVELVFGSLTNYKITYLFQDSSQGNFVVGQWGYDTTNNNWQFLNNLLVSSYSLTKAKVGATVKFMFTIPSLGSSRISFFHNGSTTNTNSTVKISISRNWNSFRDSIERPVF